MEPVRLSDYDYYLPEELIAQEPLENRDKSRMLVLYRKEGKIKHTIFDQLPVFLERGDLLILNDTRVIPARLVGQIAGKSASAELLLLYKQSNGNWVAMVKPGRKLKPGARVVFDADVEASIEGYAEKDFREVSFNAPRPIEEILPRLGKVPLPPYIQKDVEDPNQYQTIYAAKEGSAAAPTAGFHFTNRVFEQLKEKGIETAFVTLHIGPGTFQPVKTEDIRDHNMHAEYYSIEKQVAEKMNEARRQKRRIIAVGTTVCRVLETAADQSGFFEGQEWGWTELFIYPGYKFRAIDAMLTNFHLPKSTLLMMVSALAGYNLVMKAYQEAVEKQYRFYSFGDCMLII
ncbi:MAG: tRNA preQ1(34) S-adenosylmethionine ribosyltransferase-isomerase QueA [Bacillota bacterium]